MSIYASLPAPDNQHTDDCAIWIDDGDGCLEPDGECDCHFRETPIIYRGSHILPTATDARDGWVDIALIPSHITPPGGNHDAPEDGPPHPFLRFGVNDETVVLEPAHVQQIVDSLTEWLTRVSSEVRG